MANTEKTPILITCSCGLTPTLNFVSIGQSCEPRNCGATLCTSRLEDDRFDVNGNCIAVDINQVCIPDYGSLSQAEKCRNRRYQKVVTEDRSGGGNHGKITTTQYSVDGQGKCISTTTCGGTGVVTYKTSGQNTITSNTSIQQYNLTCDIETNTVNTTTWNANCTSTFKQETNGKSSSNNTITTSLSVNSCTTNYSCSSTLKDGKWNGSASESVKCKDGFSQSKTLGINGTCSDIFNNGCYWKGGGPTNTTEYTPPLDCSITTTYSQPDNEQVCTPTTLPSYPAFTKCDTEPSALQPGQGYSNNAYKYVDLYEPLKTSEQKIKYRVEHPPIFPACYLKVWVTKITQKWRQESCATQSNPCCLRLVKDGQPIKTDEPAYIWISTNCDYDLEEDLSKCEHVIYGPEREIVAGQNEEVTIEIKKYSYVQNYEPEDPDQNGNQPCRPNGWPLIKC